MLEIAQAAVDQLGRCGGGAAPEIGLLAKIDRKAAAGRIACDAATVDPAADDRDIVSCVHSDLLEAGKIPLSWRERRLGTDPQDGPEIPSFWASPRSAGVNTAPSQRGGI